MSIKAFAQKAPVKLSAFALIAIAVFALAWYAGSVLVPDEVVENFKHQFINEH